MVDEDEAQVVSKLFHLYAIERQGVPTIVATLKAQHGFTRTVANTYLMLRNPAYAGTMTYQGIEVPCPPVVSRALWDKAQDLLTKKTVRAARGNTKVNYLLQGLVRCESCGRVLSARTRRERGRVLRYYRCRAYAKSCRPKPYIKADDLEAKVWGDIKNVLIRPDLLVERFNDTHGDTLAADIDLAEREVAKWTRRNERLVSLYVRDAISEDEFEHERRYVREPLEAAQSRLADLRGQGDTAGGRRRPHSDVHGRVSRVHQRP